MSNRLPETTHGNRQLHYRRNLIRQLIGDFTSQKCAGWKRSLLIRAAMPRSLHCLEKIEGHVKTCAQCMVKKRKTQSDRGIQTAYKCKRCKIPLCRIGCFLAYHKREGWKYKTEKSECQIRVLDKAKHAYKYTQCNILVLGLYTVSTKKSSGEG
jgi:hypothetical protein